MSSKYQEDIYETYTSGAKNVDAGSPYLHDLSPPDSDNESLSDSSRKIRKKRNTYQKISDDIRVQLLDAVQNGETLKSAAKRHKINYSSAKSILHTYRKEGRILKKSAQERTTKKRVSSTDMERPSKISKLSRKENMEPEDDDDMSQTYVPTKDKKHEEESEEKNHVMGLLNSGHYDHGDHDIQPASEAAAPNGHHAYPKGDGPGPLTVRKHENVAEKHHGDYHKGAQKGDHHGYKPRSYDTAHMNYHDGHEAAEHHAHYGGHHHPHHHREGGHDHTNYYYSRELDSFNDAVNMWQARSAHQDPSAFMGYHRYGMPTHLEAVHKAEYGAEHDDHADSSVGYLLKSFMDIQGNHHYHQPRKSSFVSYNGNGLRKESFDFI